MLLKKGLKVFVIIISTLLFLTVQAGAQQPIKIGIVQGFSGALEAYAKQMLTGFKMGAGVWDQGQERSHRSKDRTDC